MTTLSTRWTKAVTAGGICALLPKPPKTAEELLAYAQAHPGKVGYARPSNSGPGRTFLMGLPYILGDSALYSMSAAGIRAQQSVEARWR